MSDRTALPAWAQEELARLEARVDELEARRQWHPTDRSRPSWLDALVEEAARAYDVSVEALLSHRRDAQSIRARMAVYYALRDHGLSYPHIGHLMDRNHATIINGIRKVEEDPEAVVMALALAVRSIPQNRWAG
jgi:chromosomal replication initiation ATPase DnaA